MSAVLESNRSRLSADLFAKYASTRDRETRNEIVELHADVANYFVSRYRNRGVPAEDLHQVAMLAIVRAVDRFDPARGFEFSTFASRTIEGELKRYFRDRTWTVRPPRNAQELYLRLRRAEDDLVHHLGRSPTVHELADEMGESVDHVLEAMEAGVSRGVASLDQTHTGPDGDSAGSVADRVLATSDDGFGQVERQLVVTELLAGLDERERLVIQLRFFENRTQDEIAEQLGVSQSYLSRILRRVLLDLRQQLGDDWDLTAAV